MKFILCFSGWKRTYTFGTKFNKVFDRRKLQILVTAILIDALNVLSESEVEKCLEVAKSAKNEC